jgi:hypothetical protein
VTIAAVSGQSMFHIVQTTSIRHAAVAVLSGPAVFNVWRGPASHNTF